MMSRLNRKIRKMMATGRLRAFGREGFTLVEIMMVLMILTLGVLPIAVIQHRARDQVSEADRATQAIAVGQAQLERITGMGFGNTLPGNGQVGNVTWTATVTNVSFGMDRVEVTVTWDNDGFQETITMADLVSMR
jgi:prepilin-type N-terminal cleavage/methylation domain-containing protein